MQYSQTDPLNIKGERMRFLCEHNGDVYKLYVGQGMVREFTNETLPDEIKSLIAMINVFDWNELHKTNIGPLSQWLDDQSQILWSAKPYYPPIANDIGWRINNAYALVLPQESFLKLRGEQES